MNLITHFFVILFLIFASQSVNASALDDALRAYKEKQYHKAAVTLLGSQTNLDTLSAVDKLKAAIIFINNAKFHKEVASKTLKTQRIYLESLETDQDQGKSQFIHLYLAEIYIHLNQFELASKHLENFLALDTVNENYKNLAHLYKAWIALKNDDKNAYTETTKKLKGKHLIIDLATEFIRIRENIPTKNSEKLSTEISKNFIINNVAMSSRVGNYALSILLAEGSLESARAIYNRLPFHSPSHVEEITSIKIINFYESTLPNTLEKFYSAYAKHMLNQISKDVKYGDLATFYLSELYILENNHETAHEYTKKVKTLVRLPGNLQPLKEIRSSTHGYLDGKHSRAYQVWEEAIDNDKNDPTLSADAVLMCLLVDGNCPTLIQKAQLAAENSRSQRFAELSTHVGRYFLTKDLDEKALRLLEIALDRSDMNSLLANDPILLLNLAEAYRVNKKYSKSLQVYFSLGQNFPIMRQIQDAVQGEYLLQQRSSGQSNVF